MSQSQSFLKNSVQGQEKKFTLISDRNFQNIQQEDIPKLLNKLIDPEKLRQQRREIAKDKYKQLLQKIQYNDIDLPPEKKVYKYTQEGLIPYINFIKLLAKKPPIDNEILAKSLVNRLKVWIPDTIVLNDGDLPPMWFYSNPQGYVFRTDSFTSKNVSSKLANFTSPDELVAVIKKPHYKNLDLAGNEIKLVSCRELPQIIGQIFANKSELSVIQKFIKSNGPKAFVCRTVWRKEANAYCWIITNKADFFKEEDGPEQRRYIANPQLMGTCTIVHTCRGRYVEETVPYIQNLNNYLQIHLGVTFQEFIVDFIKDESGIWWFINVKGWEILILNTNQSNLSIKCITNFGDELSESQIEVNVKKPIRNKNGLVEICSKMKICKYCEQLYPELELCHKMTLKMVIQTDKHLYWRGKDYDWLTRSDVPNLEVANLYHEHKVCKQCYMLYMEIDKLIKVEAHFNRVLGVPVNEETQYNMLSVFGNKIPTDLQSAREQGDQNSNQIKRYYYYQDTQIYDISTTKQLILKQDNVPLIHNTEQKRLNRFRFIVLIHSLRDIPQNFDISKNYYLEYTIFDQKQRIKLDFQGAILYDKGYFININRMRLFYLFSNARKGLHEYIQHQRALTMYLYQENRKIGTLDLELQDFLSERVIRREFMKVFSGKELLPILSWGVNLTLGLVDSGPVSVNRIKLQDHLGLSIPNCDYYTSEPLPTEWMAILNQKKDVDMTNLAFHNFSVERSQSLIRKDTLRFAVSQQQTLTYSQTIPKQFKQDPEITSYSKFQRDSFGESTRVMESQVQLQKELLNYGLDEEEERKRKRKNKRRVSGE